MAYRLTDMFGPQHIHKSGRALCHASGGLVIQFAEAESINPGSCCADCLRRYKNITGKDLQKPEINKALLREITEILNDNRSTK